LLGPLTNPAGADAQVMGVYDSSRVEAIARVLSNLGSRHAFVVAGSDGMDELTLAGPTLVAEALGGDVKTFEISPEDVGLGPASNEEIQGQDAEHNAKILRDVLGGERGPHRDIVLFNAAAAIIAGGASEDWKPAIDVATQSIDSGSALKKLDALIALSQA
jgi:anthranilate phosphoribosyltransferase